MDLQLIREQKSGTQLQLADKIGKDRSLIAKIESGVTSPSVDTAKVIAKELDLGWTIFLQNYVKAIPIAKKSTS